MPLPILYRTTAREIEIELDSESESESDKDGMPVADSFAPRGAGSHVDIDSDSDSTVSNISGTGDPNGNPDHKSKSNDKSIDNESEKEIDQQERLPYPYSIMTGGCYSRNKTDANGWTKGSWCWELNDQDSDEDGENGEDDQDDASLQTATNENKESDEDQYDALFISHTERDSIAGPIRARGLHCRRIDGNDGGSTRTTRPKTRSQTRNGRTHRNSVGGGHCLWECEICCLRKPREEFACCPGGTCNTHVCAVCQLRYIRSRLRNECDNDNDNDGNNTDNIINNTNSINTLPTDTLLRPSKWLCCQTDLDVGEFAKRYFPKESEQRLLARGVGVPDGPLLMGLLRYLQGVRKATENARAAGFYDEEKDDDPQQQHQQQQQQQYLEHDNSEVDRERWLDTLERGGGDCDSESSSGGGEGSGSNRNRNNNSGEERSKRTKQVPLEAEPRQRRRPRSGPRRIRIGVGVATAERRKPPPGRCGWVAGSALPQSTRNRNRNGNRNGNRNRNCNRNRNLNRNRTATRRAATTTRIDNGVNCWKDLESDSDSDSDLSSLNNADDLGDSSYDGSVCNEDQDQDHEEFDSDRDGDFGSKIIDSSRRSRSSDSAMEQKSDFPDDNDCNAGPRSPETTVEKNKKRPATRTRSTDNVRGTRKRPRTWAASVDNDDDDDDDVPVVVAHKRGPRRTTRGGSSSENGTSRRTNNNSNNSYSNHPKDSDSDSDSDSYPRQQQQKADTKCWMAMFSRLVSYKNNNGTTMVVSQKSSSSNNNNNNINNNHDPQLGKWVTAQRQSHKNNTMLSYRRDMLNSIGFVWDVQEQRRAQWMAMFAKLVAYKNRHGTTVVPRNCTEDPALGRWVVVQRSNSKQKKLMGYRRELLDSIGFVWDATEAPRATWMVMFQKLVAHQTERNSKVVVPARCDDPSVVDWIYRQRQLFQNGVLSEDRRALLDSTGFEWDGRQRQQCHDNNNNNKNHKKSRTLQWASMFELLVEYKKLYLDTNVPTNWKEDPKLSAWVQRQRERFKNGTLPKEWFDLLDALGFAWSPALEGDLIEF